MRMAYQHILFATDFSKINIKMHQKLEQLALVHKAKVSAMHVITGIEAFAHNHNLTLDLKDTLELHAKQKLNDICQELQIPDGDQIIATGDPVTAILETMSDIGADLLVVGSYGQSGFFHRLGSVSQKLVNKSNQDVLIIK